MVPSCSVRTCLVRSFQWSRGEALLSRSSQLSRNIQALLNFISIELLLQCADVRRQVRQGKKKVSDSGTDSSGERDQTANTCDANLTTLTGRKLKP